MKNFFKAIGLVCVFVLGACATQSKQNDIAAVSEVSRAPANYVVSSFPILERLESQGQRLSERTLSWMKKWRGVDLDDSSKFQFKELSGSTSINLKIQKIDPSDEKGYKSLGSFVPRNGAANPNTEIGYFNLAAILGWDHIIRPAVRYELGPVASQRFKSLINSTPIKGGNRIENKTRILNAIATGNPLKGCLKAKNPDAQVAFDAIANPSAAPNGGPRSSHPLIAALQAGNSKPKAGVPMTLKTGYVGDSLELAREYSVLMTLDSIFQQWDRYSGGNVTIDKDDNGVAHIYSTDNGGADISKTSSWTERNLGWFSRYDRPTIEKLRSLYEFLGAPGRGFLGYTDAESFVVDLGLYSELPPATYVERLRRNLKLLLDKVAATESRYGSNAYLD